MTSKTTSPWESNRKAQAVAKEVLGVIGASIVPDDLGSHGQQVSQRRTIKLISSACPSAISFYHELSTIKPEVGAHPRWKEIRETDTGLGNTNPMTI